MFVKWGMTCHLSAWCPGQMEEKLVVPVPKWEQIGWTLSREYPAFIFPEGVNLLFVRSVNSADDISRSIYLLPCYNKHLVSLRYDPGSQMSVEKEEIRHQLHSKWNCGWKITDPIDYMAFSACSFKCCSPACQGTLLPCVPLSLSSQENNTFDVTSDLADGWPWLNPPPISFLPP